MNKTKNCPFCGGNLTVTKGGSSIGPVNKKPYWTFIDVDCDDCKFSMSFDENNWTVEKVIEWVNTRPIEDELQAKNNNKDKRYVEAIEALSNANGIIIEANAENKALSEVLSTIEKGGIPKGYIGLTKNAGLDELEEYYKELTGETVVFTGFKGAYESIAKAALAKNRRNET